MPGVAVEVRVAISDAKQLVGLSGFVFWSSSFAYLLVSSTLVVL